MRASPDYLTHGRYAPLEQRGWKLGRSVARHMGVAVHTRYRVRNNQIRRLDRQVAVAEVGGQQELEELVWSPGGSGAAVEAGLVASQRLVQQPHKLA